MGLPLFAQSPVAPSAPPGALLYQTHCIGCHDQKVHWRDTKLVTDWTSLVAQVRRWQANTGLSWSDANIEDVARYLNAIIYKFPEQVSRQTG